MQKTRLYFIDIARSIAILLMLEGHFDQNSKEIKSTKLKARQDFMKLAGIVQAMPPADYSGTIDEVLYGGDELP